MARLNAKWDNFDHRGQTWDHFWQDSTAAGPASIVGAGGIASGEAFGQPTVGFRWAITGAGGIASGQAFGSDTFASHVAVTGEGGIASAEAFGAPTITYRLPVVGVGGIASAEAFGAPTVTHLGSATDLQGGGAWRDPPHFVVPHGFTLYTPFVVPMWVKVREAGGIPSGEVFGRPMVTIRRDARRRRREEELLAA